MFIEKMKNDLFRLDYSFATYSRLPELSLIQYYYINEK